MLNIVILEDQMEQAERLNRMLEKYASSHPNFNYTLKHYTRSIPMLTEYKCDADRCYATTWHNIFVTVIRMMASQIRKWRMPSE